LTAIISLSEAAREAIERCRERAIVSKKHILVTPVGHTNERTTQRYARKPGLYGSEVSMKFRQAFVAK
jgi:hypothetical protein